jgi:lipopolysaccharide transport system permease protein
LVQRDMQVIYKRALLGFGWALAIPVVQLIVYSFVFRRALSIDADNYSAFVFSGVLVWGWFHSSIGEGTGLITSNRPLVGQPGFPLAVLPYVTVWVRMLHFLAALPLLIGLLWWDGMRPTATWLFIPVLLAIQYLFTVALTYPLAALNVVFRDTQHLTRAALQLGMFLTPVFYSLDSVPEQPRRLLEANPMTGLLEAWRASLMYGRAPDPAVLASLLGLALVLLASGRWFFVRQSHRFLEEL